MLLPEGESEPLPLPLGGADGEGVTVVLAQAETEALCPTLALSTALTEPLHKGEKEEPKLGEAARENVPP